MLRAIAKFRSLHARIEAVARQLCADERGVSGIVTAMALTALMGFSGLAIDVVMWEANQRSMQGAVDQAALGAATAFRNANESGALGDSTTAQNAAYATAIQSGYPAASVTLAAYNSPPTCTNDGCLRVTITQQQQRYFTGIFLTSNVSVSVSAVGTCNGCGNGAFNSASTGGDACVMALDASGSGVITASGNPTLSLNKCNLYNNSPNTAATILNGGATIEGCGSTIYTSACGSRAFLAQPDIPAGNIDIPIVTSAAPAPDPYANLVAPSTAGCAGAPAFPNTATVAPGTYSTAPGHNQVVNLSPAGTYVFCAFWQANAQSVITGTGVTLYVLGGAKINGGSTMGFSAPTSGPYAGVALWFGDTNQVTYNGNNTSTFVGAIYAPKATVDFGGTAVITSTCTRLIAAAINLHGTPTGSFNNSGCPSVAGPVLTQSGVSGGTQYTGAPMLIQ